MALVIKDRVKETTTTTGTGTYTLAGSEVGFQSFSTIGDGNTTYYAVTNNNDWEVGIGTYTASGTTLARTTILSSSNSNNAVNWSSGEKYVIVTQPSSKASFLDANGDLNLSGDIVVSGTVDGRDIATNIPASLGTAGQVLTVNSGATAGEWAASGGGGADLYAANESSPTAQPSATGTNAIAIGDSAISSNTESFAFGKSRASGSKSFAAAIDNNSTSYGASGANSIAMGLQASAEGGISLGSYSSTASGTSVAIGNSASTSIYGNSVAIGRQATSTNSFQITLGHTHTDVKISSAYTLPKVDGSANQVLTTNGSGAVSWAAAGGGGSSPDLYAENYDGTSTAPSATGTNAVAIGVDASSTATRGFAVLGSVSSGEDGIAMGKTSSATGNYPIAIGYGASANSRGVSIGQSTTTTGNGSVAIGQTVYANPSSGDGAVGLGYLAYAKANRSFANSSSRAGGDSSIALGITNQSSTYGASGANSIALGQLSKATQANSIAIGDGAISTTANQIALGGATDTVKISNTYTLPTVDGTAGQVLSTDGNGNLSWVTP